MSCPPAPTSFLYVFFFVLWFFFYQISNLLSHFEVSEEISTVVEMVSLLYFVCLVSIFNENAANIIGLEILVVGISFKKCFVCTFLETVKIHFIFHAFTSAMAWLRVWMFILFSLVWFSFLFFSSFFFRLAFLRLFQPKMNQKDAWFIHIVRFCICFCT